MQIVSACLAGVKCRYDGRDNTCEAVRELVLSGQAIPVCPEVVGGLPIPRIPCEQIIKNEKLYVIDQKGIDLTSYFTEGARKTLEIAKAVGATSAILKSKSPSCGCGRIYSGFFNGELIRGDGITTRLLKEHHIVVKTEEDM